MSNISILSRLVNGAQRNVDLSVNTLVVQALSTGTNTLTDTILGRLISLQNGSDVGATFHTHDTLYTRTAALASSATGSAGSTLIGDNNSYINFTPATATVKGALSAIDSALSSAAVAYDGTFRIDNTTDPTKKIAFSAAGISTGTTRTITMPNSDVNLGLVATSIQASGSVTFTASQSMGGFNLTNLANAVNPQDATTLSQVQQYLAGIDWKQHVRAMSDSSITLSGTQTVDGVLLVAGDRILVQNQASAANNGIYVVAAGAWSRSSDANTGPALVAASVFVDEGTAYKGTAWTQTAPSPITVGTTAIVFVKFASILPLAFRNGLTQTGQNVDVTPGDTSLTAAAQSLIVNLNAAGAIVTSSGLKINLEASNPTLQIAANALGIKLDAARAITTGAAGVGVNVDNSTLTITANAVAVKSAGITAVQIATTAYDQATIVGGAGTAASVANAPKIQTLEVSGQALSATALVALRYALASDAGSTPGQMFKADYTATTTDNFYVIGLAYPSSAVSIGGSVTLVEYGIISVPAHGFTTGAPLYLSAAGALTSSAPSTPGQAVVRVGTVKDANSIFVHPVPVGVL